MFGSIAWRPPRSRTSGCAYEQRQQLAGSYPLGRLGTSDDVASAALFLASAASSWITRITLDIAGGSVMP
nr:SDR family oxidoreductase [Nocardia sp. SYP-A9097]